jgi:hypothetical protein
MVDIGRQMTLYKICRRSGKIGETEIIWRRGITFKAVDDEVCKEKRNPEV